MQLGVDFACGTTLVAEEMYTKLEAGHGNHVRSFGDVEIIRCTLSLRNYGRQTIRVKELERPHGVRIVAFERADGSVSSIPDGDSILYEGNVLVVCLRPEFLQAFQRYMKESV
jgi:trk system potassium uptake protein TrkA